MGQPIPAKREKVFPKCFTLETCILKGQIVNFTNIFNNLNSIIDLGMPLEPRENNFPLRPGFVPLFVDDSV